MKTYCIAYTPAGTYPDSRQINAHREFIDDIHTKREAFKKAKILFKYESLLIYIDMYEGEPDDPYANLRTYWHVTKRGKIV